MTGINPQNSGCESVVDIFFHYEAHDYISKVIETGNPDKVLEISIRVGDTFVLGSESGGVSGWPCTFLFEMIDSVRSVTDGSRSIIEFAYGPCWLGLHPHNSEVCLVGATLLSGAKDPSQRLDVDVAASSTTIAWCEAVIAAGRDFYNYLISLDEELGSTESLQSLDKQLSVIEGFFEEHYNLTD